MFYVLTFVHCFFIKIVTIMNVDILFVFYFLIRILDYKLVIFILRNMFANTSVF